MTAKAKSVNSKVVGYGRARQLVDAEGIRQAVRALDAYSLDLYEGAYRDDIHEILRETVLKLEAAALREVERKR